jgi:hypothetical protein
MFLWSSSRRTANKNSIEIRLQAYDWLEFQPWYVSEQSIASPRQAQALGISAQALHRHLKKMVDDKVLMKRGESPIVFYDVLSVISSQDHDPWDKVTKADQKEIAEHL